ncbi:MAG: AEC family transporter [Alphaproteobacteria bacterium]|nr:AEC family transporter [Alphaproteobacteria bacterium]
MILVFASLLPVFIVIAVGFGLRKSGLVPAEHWRGVELISYWVLIPALLITVLADAVLEIGQATAFAATVLLTASIVSVAMWLARRPLRHFMGVEGPAFTSLFQTTTRWHGFIALAVASRLFGDPGLALLALAFAVLVPLLNTSSILVLAAYAGDVPAPLDRILKSLVRNPIMWGLIIGLGLRFSGLGLPEVVKTTLDLAGDGALGVSLLALGAGLSWRAVRRTGREVVLGTFVKLIVTPLIAIALAVAIGLTGMDFVIVVLASAVPTAVNGYVLAREMGGDTELYAATLTAQVLASFVTLPLFLAWAMQFTGLA